MIIELTLWLNHWEPVVNFILHIAIFVSMFYVAIHNRNLRKWQITPLWYAALASLLAGITILIQWTLGSEHPLSYWSIGRLAETLFNATVASIAVGMFLETIAADLKHRKKRKYSDE